MRHFFLWFFLTITSFANLIISDDEYKILKKEKYTITYTKENEISAKFFANNLDKFLEFNDKSFGFSFDEPMQIILVSNKNQEANAYSTQVPFNMGAYYNGGGGANDYFATNSWLKVLFIHEIAHNYQLNAKKSKVSKVLHRYLGNNVFPLFTPIVSIPLFTMPNVVLPTIFVEGNAVLNESIFSNGGRLHSGYQNALKNVIILDNKLDIIRFINDHQDFPYLTEKYIIGGYFMEYLAHIYGVDKVNQFFYENSESFAWPFFINKNFLNHFHKSYKTLFEEFIRTTKQRYKSFNWVRGNHIASSQSEIELSKIDDKVLFITTDLKTKKQLNSFDMKTKQLETKDTTLLNNKVFMFNKQFYTNGNYHINKEEVKFGLFDKNLYIKKDTVGKDIKDQYKNKFAYIKIDESFIKSKLYVDNLFINEVASSALFDEMGNIYYFKQENTKRILYKNKQKLFTYEGYYGKIVDIVDDSIYFVANSKNGSGLYRYKNNQLKRLSKADNIINAKVLSDNKALVVSVESSGYYAYTIELHEFESQIPLSSVAHLETDFEFKKTTTEQLDNAKTYNVVEELRYVNMSPYYYYNSLKEDLYGLTINFSDPLMFNQLALQVHNTDSGSLFGLSYLYNRGKVPLSLSISKINKDNKTIDEREYGASIQGFYTILQKGRNYIDATLKFYLDNEQKEKNPFLLQSNYRYGLAYPFSLANDLYTNLSGIYKNDRKDSSYRASFDFEKHLFNEFYINTKVDYIKSTTNSFKENRGNLLTNDLLELTKDATSLYVQSLDNDFYFKEAKSFSIGLKKSLHFSKYSYWLPFSLQNELLYMKYNEHNIKRFSNITIKENIIGIQFNTLFIHKITLPIDVKYIKSNYSKNEKQFAISLGVAF